MVTGHKDKKGEFHPHSGSKGGVSENDVKISVKGNNDVISVQPKNSKNNKGFSLQIWDGGSQRIITNPSEIIEVTDKHGTKIKTTAKNVFDALDEFGNQVREIKPLPQHEIVWGIHDGRMIKFTYLRNGKNEEWKDAAIKRYTEKYGQKDDTNKLNLQHGDEVEFLGADNKVRKGRVTMKSSIDNTWVVNTGGAHGIPALVNGNNFVRVVK